MPAFVLCSNSLDRPGASPLAASAAAVDGRARLAVRLAATQRANALPLQRLGGGSSVPLCAAAAAAAAACARRSRHGSCHDGRRIRGSRVVIEAAKQKAAAREGERKGEGKGEVPEAEAKPRAVPKARVRAKAKARAGGATVGGEAAEGGSKAKRGPMGEGKPADQNGLRAGDALKKTRSGALRFDLADFSGPWTQAEFEEHYGGLEEWKLAEADDDGFIRRPDMDAFSGKDAWEMSAEDISECYRVCREHDFGGFTVWADWAYFRRQAPRDLCRNLVRCEGALHYINTRVELEKQAIDCWTSHQTSLMDLEWREEERQVRTRLEEWPLHRLINQGLTLVDLKVETNGSFFGEPCVKFRPAAGGRLPLHEYQRGDEVIVSEGDVLDEEWKLRAQVVDVTPEAIQVVMTTNPRKDVTYRLDRGVNKIVYERTLRAVQQFASKDKFLARHVRRVLVGAGDIEELNREEEELEMDWRELEHLNDPQREAIASLVNKRIGLIQGPPGCGKTFTACSFLKAVSKKRTPLLAVADSHVAVDQLLGGLLKLGVHAVRLGAPASITDEALRRASVQVQFEDHWRYEEWKEARAAWQHEEEVAQDLRRKMRRERDEEKQKALKDEFQAAADKATAFKKLFRKLEGDIIAEIVDGAEVVCSTLAGCSDEAVAGRHFPLVLVDEATQATEPRVLIAANRLSYFGRLVLVGDQQQLPPVCMSQMARDMGLGMSLFERLLRHGNSLTPGLLKVQFRMHPLISRWPSDRFYDGQLKDGVTAAKRPPMPGFDWPAAGPVAFVPCTTPEQGTRDGSSKQNEGECDIVLSLLDRLLRDVKPEDIGVISPYRGQVSMLKKALRGTGVEVRTVDGYQGREKPLIIFSCVRSNPAGKVGFLSDYRRLNVALTRAQRGVIVIGNDETLRRDKHWSSWLDFVEENELRCEAAAESA
eukprot:CAMPEP_0203855348 /NCGR_PEP_ID=MMETSP0359-20131031/9590_1 /ASSEMBLY_ACC=CAM_ASM_000338 /TAXON_ID=268821 /ORGANISM="Scrippsiella Hangoei, Strain SHTV-5" /LENGTH=933 /DNA_ID=CAMNT_0050771895 /DNA_START=50 /DNA_END=2848 /DNA_ORIENTATION=-